MPSSRLSSKNSSWISRPVLVSRLPVGSSASSSRGRKQQRARQRHPLLLAAGQLARPVREPLAEADPAPGSPPPARRSVRARQPQDQPRHHRVLERGELRQEVVELEDEADLAVAELGQPRRRSSTVTSTPSNGDRPRRGRVERAEDLQERRLADARGADHRDHLAGRAGRSRARAGPRSVRPPCSKTFERPRTATCAPPRASARRTRRARWASSWGAPN